MSLKYVPASEPRFPGVGLPWGQPVGGVYVTRGTSDTSSWCDMAVDTSSAMFCFRVSGLRVQDMGLRLQGLGASLIRNAHPPSITIGPYAQGYRRFLGGGGFLWCDIAVDTSSAILCLRVWGSGCVRLCVCV